METEAGETSRPSSAGSSVVGTISDDTDDETCNTDTIVSSLISAVGANARASTDATSAISVHSLGELRRLQATTDADEISRGDWVDVGALGPGRPILAHTRARGLTVVRRYLTDEEHHDLLDAADDVLGASCASSDGSPGEATSLPANQAVFLGSDSFPPFVTALAMRVADDMTRMPHVGPVWSAVGEGPRFNHLLVNEYYPGEGILAHVDLPHRFADGIVGISLGAATVFRLAPASEDTAAAGYTGDAGDVSRGCDVLLLPGDLYALEEDARWLWTHRIDAVDRDVWRDHWIVRGRR